MSLFTYRGKLTCSGKFGNLLLAFTLFCTTLFQGVVICLCPDKHPTCCENHTMSHVCEVAHTCETAHHADADYPEAMHHRCEHLYLDSVPPAEYAQRERIRVLIALITCALHAENTIFSHTTDPSSEALQGRRYERVVFAPFSQIPAQRLC